jgi:16S rRNA (guanine966-N2)-methyltransferase
LKIERVTEFALFMGVMRIIGGVAAGRLLKVPPGYDVRPTPDLVRQAVFNSLASFRDGAGLAGARVLDLFSGSGAIGLECLSRGAVYVVSVEKANRHARMIQENLARLENPEFSSRHSLRTQDVSVAISQLAQSSHADSRFDLIIADPPFGEKNVNRRSSSLSQALLDNEALPTLLADDGLFVLGHTKRDTLSLPEWWVEVKEMRHGDSMMRFLKKRV